jgi:hypothetical protein
MVLSPVTFSVVNALKRNNLIPVESTVVDMQYTVKCFSVFLSLQYMIDSSTRKKGNPSAPTRGLDS